MPRIELGYTSVSMDGDLKEILDRPLVFVSGKGGVGKTAISQGIALAQARKGLRTLWVCFEDPTRPHGEIQEMGPGLFHLNAEFSTAFEEYVGMKAKAPRLAHLFLQNKVMKSLSRAAPGLHELVLLGKVWHERNHFDRLVIDMPSTGHGLAMFQSTANFTALFQGGPIQRDAERMLSTFKDPRQTGHLIVALPEEMPLIEALELSDFLRELFPDNKPAFLVNRLFPPVKKAPQEGANPDEWKSPIPASTEDYAEKRSALEAFNLRIWQDKKVAFAEVPFFPAGSKRDTQVAQSVGDFFMHERWI